MWNIKIHTSMGLHRGNFFQISCVNHFPKSTVYWTTRLKMNIEPAIEWHYLVMFIYMRTKS